MSALSRMLIIAAVAGCVVGVPATAQSKNPIQTASRPSQPSNPRTASAASPEAASGDCCSPDALRTIASSAGFLDIVGIKLGMTPEQAFAAVKAFNGRMKIEVVNSRMEFPDGPLGNVHPVPQFAVAHTVGLQPNPNFPALFTSADGSSDVIVIEFTIPPSPPLVARIVRQVSFPNGQPVVASNLLNALRKKYGQEKSPAQRSAIWMFDSAGKTVSRPLQQSETICLSVNLFAGLGGWAGGLPGPADMGRDAPTQLNVSGLALDDINSGIPPVCRPFVMAAADPLGEGTPPNEQMAQMTVSVYSSGLLYGSRKAAHDWLQAKADAKTRQQEDAAKARTAPKL